MTINRQVVLAARPSGIPRRDDFAIVESPRPSPAAGELLIAARFLSADPLQRWRMEARAEYGDTIALDTVVWGRMVGVVLASRHPDWHEGDYTEGMLGWQEYAISRGESGRARYAPGVTRVDPSLAPISTALGILGMPGVTAYFALNEICRPQRGETVVVSAAAGTVGSLAGQLARLVGARVVGIAGGAAKCRHLIDDLRFDAAIDYRSEPDLLAAIRTACPERIHAYFDNVGGAVSDTVLRHLAPRARVALVGRVAQLTGPATRLDVQEHLITSRARVEGFIVYDYAERATEAHHAIASALKARDIRYFETVHEGIEAAPQALIDVLQGRGRGKHVIRIAGANF